jgi:predicted amidophosphoribosyltransferase
MAKWCLYCRLRFPEAAQFCSECGRPLESGFRVHPIREHPMHPSETPGWLHKAPLPGKGHKLIPEKR